MTKIFLVLGIGFFAFSAGARAGTQGLAGGSGFRVVCQTQNAQVAVWDEGGSINFKFYDAEGFQNFPIYEGVVTPGSLPHLANSVEGLKDIDGRLQLSWPRSECTTDPARPYLVSCHGEGTVVEPAGKPLKTYSMLTYLNHQETLDAKYEILNIMLSIADKDSVIHLITIPFLTDFCRAQPAAILR